VTASKRPLWTACAQAFDAADLAASKFMSKRLSESRLPPDG